MMEELAPEIAHCAPGRLCRRVFRAARWSSRSAGPPARRLVRFRRAVILRARGKPRVAGADFGAARPRRRHQHPVHQRHDGLPKGATLSHRNILNNGFFLAKHLRLTPSDRLCIPVPLYHCFGMVIGNLSCVTHGATIVYPSAGFEPRAVLETVERDRCTGLLGVPTMFIAELEHPDFARFDLSSLRTGMMAGAPCPIEVMRRVVSEMHMRDVTIGYGMTETSPVIFQTVPTIRSNGASRRSVACCRTWKSRLWTRAATSCRAATRANFARAAIR